MRQIEARLIQTQQELEAIYYQRWLVLRSHLGMAQGTERDKYDETIFHLIAACPNEMVPANYPFIVGSAQLRELSPELGGIAHTALLVAAVGTNQAGQITIASTAAA